MFSAIVFAAATLAGCAQDPERSEVVPAKPAPDVASLVAAWLAEEASASRDERCAELVALGAPVVPAMQCLVTERSPAMALALQVLCGVGEPARPALPQIVAIVGDREFVEPPGQPAHVSVRGSLFSALRDAAWAAEELVPVIAKVAADPRESGNLRMTAIYLLARMGSTATPVLCGWIADASGEPFLRETALGALAESGADAPDVVRAVAENPADPAQARARHVLARMEERAGRQTQADYWTALIRESPFHPHVRGWLMSVKKKWHLDHVDPLTQEIKQLWRARLAEAPDAELAWQTALLVQDQLESSELDYEGRHEYLGREDPAESYATLAALLRTAADTAEKWTPRWQRSLRALAKIGLLRGDWEAMNAALVELGQKPVPAESRPWLAPPPKVWNDLADHWPLCDEALRGGDCAFELRVEKDGHGVRGVHVLLREKIEQHGFSTGIETRTLFLDPVPVAQVVSMDESRSGGFGYAADDRTQARYAVTDDTGVARFEKLPPMTVTLEVMIPTANFAEAVARYDLWVREPDGSLELSGYRWHEGFALASGTTTPGPDLVVRPHFAMNVVDGQAIAPDFELAWDPLPPPPDGGEVSYEIELTRSFPPGRCLLVSADRLSRLTTATTTTGGHVWPLARQGVGDIALVPGNVYLVQVVAKDAGGHVLGRFGRNWCYVPWRHRESPAPIVVDFARPDADPGDMPPIEAELWHHGVAALLDQFLLAHPDAFEAEYVRVGREWSRWREGDAADAATARAALDELARTLPAGNVAGETARELVRRIDAHADPGKQLDFGATSISR